jgi:hypothetical protein
MEPIILTGEGLRISDVVSVARDGRPAAPAGVPVVRSLDGLAGLLR